ncbi:hypothetical protein [Bacillus sp. AFS015802]|nr:hypothetical protein [Bacillus sp. AFS015802]
MDVRFENKNVYLKKLDGMENKCFDRQFETAVPRSMPNNRRDSAQKL